MVIVVAHGMVVGGLVAQIVVGLVGQVLLVGELAVLLVGPSLLPSPVASWKAPPPWNPPPPPGAFRQKRFPKD